MDKLTPSLIFRAANIVVAAFMIVGGVATIIAGGFQQFIRGIFYILFGVMVIVFEFRLPPIITQHVSFMFSFIGRGIFYVFIGCIILSDKPLAIASGVIVAVVGVAYSVLQFVPNVEAPSNMKRQALDDSMADYYSKGASDAEGGRASRWAAGSGSGQHESHYAIPTAGQGAVV